MNEFEAQGIASDIVETWQLTASRRIWKEALMPMTDPDAARRAYQQLRRNHQGRDMSIGMFTDAYRQHRPAQAPPAHPDCPSCGDGWVTYVEDRNGRDVTRVKPCHCPKGHDVERVWRKVTEPA